MNFFKVNVDVAIFEDQNMAGIGIVIWEHHANFVGAKCMRIPGTTNLQRAELMVAREGLIYAWEVGCRNIYI